MISFIIPAHNEASLIDRTHAAVRRYAQDVGMPYVVIVVDDASTDRTYEIALWHGARVVRVNFRQIATGVELKAVLEAFRPAVIPVTHVSLAEMFASLAA
jgi:glycosyltransferase involved in cell wall biosynthesis